MVGREFKIIEFTVAKFSDTLLKFSKGGSLFLGPATKCAIHVCDLLAQIMDFPSFQSAALA
jgi:hypothetical protein